MSAELKDFRLRVTAETDAVLEAINRTTGRDKAEIGREVLDKWAAEQIAMATVLDQLMRANGLAGIGGGIAGKIRE